MLAESEFRSLFGSIHRSACDSPSLLDDTKFKPDMAVGTKLSSSFRITRFASVSKPQNSLCLTWEAEVSVGCQPDTSKPNPRSPLVGLFPRRRFYPGSLQISNLRTLWPCTQT